MCSIVSPFTGQKYGWNTDSRQLAFHIQPNKQYLGLCEIFLINYVSLSLSLSEQYKRERQRERSISRLYCNLFQKFVMCMYVCTYVCVFYRCYFDRTILELSARYELRGRLAVLSEQQSQNKGIAFEASNITWEFKYAVAGEYIIWDIQIVHNNIHEIYRQFLLVAFRVLQPLGIISTTLLFFANIQIDSLLNVCRSLLIMFIGIMNTMISIVIYFKQTVKND